MRVHVQGAQPGEIVRVWITGIENDELSGEIAG